MDQVREILQRALAEDIGSGDITTAAIVDSAQQCRAVIVAKAEGVLAGLPVARETFLSLDSTITFNTEVDDGNRVDPNTQVAAIAGPLAPILTAERTALNFLMRMSGITTLTATFVEAVAGTRAKILDTRKTVPGLRLLDKYAVHMGGGQNHRFGLSDAILIKENHITAAGSITTAVKRIKGGADPARKVEVEARSLEEVKEALAAGVETILLDNMEVATIAESVKLASGRAACEASGGITLENVRTVAETGVDFISIGLLTHSAPALDFSLEIL